MLPKLHLPQIGSKHYSALNYNYSNCFLRIEPYKGGCWLMVVDDANKPCVVSSKNMGGAVKRVVQYMEVQEDENEWSFDWDSNEDELDLDGIHEMKIDLWKHSMVMTWLKDCDCLVDKKGRKVKIKDDKVEVKVKIEEDGSSYLSTIYVDEKKTGWQVVADEWVLRKEELVFVGSWVMGCFL
jgi:hypothetical protein